MTMRDFIRNNQVEIDAAINRSLCHVPRTASCDCPKSGTEHDHEPEPLNDEDRRGGVLNDEGLYNWARSEGCKC
jgi:hypothetical protein